MIFQFQCFHTTFTTDCLSYKNLEKANSSYLKTTRKIQGKIEIYLACPLQAMCYYKVWKVEKGKHGTSGKNNLFENHFYSKNNKD